MRDERDIHRAIEQYADLIRRICFVHLKNHADTEDVFQTVFLKYMLYPGVFEDEAHKKAWFIRVSINACKDWIRSLLRQRAVPLELLHEEPTMPEEDQEILSYVLALPPKYKDVIYLFYYEGYSAVEIASLLGQKENTIYSHLSRARALLKEQIGGEWHV